MKRRLRRLLLTIAVLLGAVVLVVLVALLVRPIRTSLLERVLLRVDDALPGTLSITHLEWPALGTLEADAVTWTDGDTLLARTGRVRVDADLSALAARRLRLHALVLLDVEADVPAVRRRLPASEPRPAATSQRGGRAFPRDGVIPGVPAVACDSLVLTVGGIGISDTLAIEAAAIEASLDLIESGRAVITQLSARTRGPDTSVGPGTLTVDLRQGTLEGTLPVVAPGGTALRLRASARGRDRFDLVFGAPDADPTGDPGLALDVTFDRDAARITGLEMGIRGRTPSTGALARHPYLRASLASVPDLAGLEATGSASLRLGSPPTAEIALVLDASPWLEGGNIRARTDGRGARLDTLELRLPDARIAARAVVDGEGLDGRVDVRMTSPASLAYLAPGVSVPESLGVELEATLAGAVGSPEIDAELSAAAYGLRLDLATHVLVDESVVAALSAIRIAPRAGGRDEAPTVGDARVEISPEGDVRVSALHVTGALGEVSAEATIPGSGRGSFRATWRVDRLPEGVAVLAALTDSTARALDATLRAQGPFRVDAEGGLEADDVALDVRAHLPGPEALAPVLPPGADVSGLGPIDGVVSLRASGGGAERRMNASARFHAPGWLDTLEVLGSSQGGATRIDTLALALDGVTLGAHGVLGSVASDVVADLDVSHVDVFRRLTPSLPPGLEVVANARAGLTGAMASPDVRVDASGRVSASTLDIPRWEVSASLDGRGLAADVQLAQGLRTPSLTLDTARLTYAAPPGSLRVVPGRLVLDARGPELTAAARATIDRTPDATGVALTTIRADSLALALGAYRARTAGPFTVRLGTQLIEVDALDMKGELGDVRVTGTLAPGASDLSASASLTLPDPPAALTVPEGLWPRDVMLDVRALRDSAHVAIRVGGFDDGGRNVTVRANATMAARATNVDLEVVDRDSTVVALAGRLPLAVDVYPFAARAIDDSLHLDARLDGVVVPVRGSGSVLREDPRAARIDGVVDVRGTLASPSVRIRIDAGFPTWPRMAPFHLRVAGGVDADGIAADLALTDTSDSLVVGRASVPATISFVPAHVEVESSAMSATLRADALDLSRLAPLMPEDQIVNGTVGLELRAGGIATDPTIDGRLGGRRLGVSLADGTRVEADMNVEVSGRAKAPIVKGTITVVNGVIVIPDAPKNLHPTTGRAVLWETSLAPPADEEIEEDVVDSVGPQNAPIAPDVDVRVVIQRGFWLRGRGLEVELAGDVRVRQKGLAPTVVGDLEVVRGQLELLGRRLTVERGVATFYGEDELDPALDISLSTHIDDTLVRVTVSGTATAPELTLGSEPEMTDGDIMSLLVLGRRLDDLNDDQAGLLEDRATDVAAQFGAARVQAALGKRLGVDIISIQQGSGPGAEESLVVGKYLTDRILVKYEQALQGTAGFLVNLEYLLTRHLRVETLTGEGRSGVEMNWTNEY